MEEILHLITILQRAVAVVQHVTHMNKAKMVDQVAVRVEQVIKTVGLAHLVKVMTAAIK
jgi:hypothetical protein